MKNPLRFVFTASIALILATFSGCNNAAESPGNALLSSGSQVGSAALQNSIAEFSKAIELAPASAKAYAGRGALKYAAGDIKGAIDDLTKAIELDPKYVTAYSGRGSAKYAAGDIAGATADFMSVAKLMVLSNVGSDSGK
ncbi:MAG: tetratricopeptide repeat protein [Chlorobium sp.]